MCSTVSAVSTISPDGKTIDLTYTFVKSHYNNNAYSIKRTGIYGTGYYTKLNINGKNNVGELVNVTYNYFNKYGPSLYFEDFKSSSTKVSVNNITAIGTSKLSSNNLITIGTLGTIKSVIAIKGTGYSSLYYINGQRLEKSSFNTIKLYENNTCIAKIISSTQYYYKKFGTYYGLIKETRTSNTSYSNGDYRSSTITTNYNRTSKGILVGKKTSGKSSGYDIINNTKESYSGVISIGTKYDPNDIIAEKYTYGNYHESLKSTSKNLKRDIPIESVFYSP
jgi:hypothetical protein